MGDQSSPNSSGGRSRRASYDSGNYISYHHPNYSPRRGSCPAVPTASAISLSLLRKERAPKRVHQIWKAFNELIDSQKNEGKENKGIGGEDKSCQTAASSERRQSVEELIDNHSSSTCANRFVIEENMQIHWLGDDRFYVEFPVAVHDDQNQNDITKSNTNSDNITNKKDQVKECNDVKEKEAGMKRATATRSVNFSRSPLKVYSTYGPEEYDRRNLSVDPFASFSIYELERRLESMQIIEIEVEKRSNEKLGFDIVGMGVNADRGSDNLSVFITSIAPGGAADRDGRLRQWDQIVEVDGESLVGVSHVYAAFLLKNTSGNVKMKIAREPDAEKSEIAKLCNKYNQ